MAAKLKLVSKNPIFWLAFKAAAFGLFLYWFNVRGGFFIAALFFIAAAWLYFRPVFNSFSFLVSFFVLIFLSLWTASILTNSFFSLLAVAFLSFLFFVILSLKNLVFVQRKAWHLFFIFSLFYISFLEFFLVDKSNIFFFKWLLFLLAAFLLFGELFKTTGVKLSPAKDGINTASMVFALIIGELMWIISWLPIGFLNSANLAILTTLLLSDLSINHFAEKLKKTTIFAEVLLFACLVAIIFLTSQWRV